VIELAICNLCQVPVEDDPHWHDEWACVVCDDCCPCKFTADGGTGDTRPLPASGDRSTTVGLALPGTAAPAVDGPLPRWMVAEAELRALCVRRERLAWLATAGLWVLVVAVGMDAR
jgi:hypothetical protein